MDTVNTTGRRKTAIARVYMNKGKGNIVINKHPMDDNSRRNNQ